MRGEMTRFYSLMYPGLLLYAARLLGDDLAYLAEDCVQDAVMSTYLNRASLEGAAHWRRYLLTSIHNRALKMLRHKNVSESFTVEGTRGAELVNDMNHELIRQETLDTLHAAIEALPEKYREILELSFGQGLRNAEIATLLDVAEITVKKRKERLLTLLRQRLGGISPSELSALLALISLEYPTSIL